MRWRSIRFRVTAIAILAVAVVLGVAAVAVVTLQRAAFVAATDEMLADRIEDVVRIARRGELSGRIPPVSGEEIVQVVAAEGQIVAATPKARKRPALAPAPPEDVPTITELRVGDDDVRVLSRAVPGVGVVHAGVDTSAAQESTAALVRSLAVTLPLVVAAMALLVWWLLGRALRPVEDIRADVADIGASDLSRRVPQPGTGDEIDRLAATMNEMLHRLDRSAEAQQQFVADAAHELRTPLARMLALIDVELADSDAPTRQALTQARDDVVGMQRITTDLLHLAQADAGELAVRREPVDLDDIVLAEARRLRTQPRPQLDASGVSAAQVLGDPVLLARAIRNLTDNAQRHARAVVRLRLSEDGEDAVLVVSDDGPGIPAADAERIFDRFVRLDAARSRGGGTGLGLAITRDIVTRHGGTVFLRPADGAGASFEMRLPRQ